MEKNALKKNNAHLTIKWKEVEDKFPKTLNYFIQYVEANYPSLKDLPSYHYEPLCHHLIYEFLETIGIQCFPIPVENEFPKYIFLIKSQKHKKVFNETSFINKNAAEAKMFMTAFAYSENVFSRMDME